MKNTLIERTFEWDANKNVINVKKHGINFNTAALVFSDEYRIDFFDHLHSIDEDRYITIGMVDRVLFVVYTERANATRIISARPATPAERRAYYGNRENYNI